MKTIGLTGGIGSGKTTVSNIFSQLQIPVFVADNVAKQIQQNDEKAIFGMKKLFGNDIYDINGNLNRKHIAKIAFSNSEILTKLNNLIHPIVKDELINFQQINSDKSFVVVESAILFQSEICKLVDFAVDVVAPLEIRINRVIKRDNVERNEVLRRISNQMDSSEVSKLCKYHIMNDGTTDLRKQIEEILERETN